MTSKDIVIDNFNLIVGSNKVLLRDTKLVISHGNKYGLIGRNGYGKTSLLNHINTIFNKTHDIFMVEQEFVANDTVMNTLRNANKKLCILMDKIKSLELLMANEDTSIDVSDDMLNEYNKLHDKLQDINFGSCEAKIKSILLGLGFTTVDFDKQVSEFSGGWRMRVSLARALYMKPNMLILDEPTNHLDLDAVIWLTKYLGTCYKKTLIIVSHDKNFLNDVCNNIILIENKSLKYFKGNYDKFVTSKRMINEENKKKCLAAEKKIIALKRKPIAQGKTALEERNKEIQCIQDSVSSLKPEQSSKIKFNFSNIQNGNEEAILVLNDASFSFGDKQILSGINLELFTNNKIVLVGKNGVGKSTLFNILRGHYSLTSGTLDCSSKIRIGYYSQHSHESLFTDMTPVEYLASQVSTELVKKLNSDIINSKYNKGKDDPMEYFYRKCLGDIGLESSVHNQKINTLSGGQKSRVAFATLFVMMPHLILLDEPTNHLDMEAIDALINCIKEFNGTVILITHNVALIESIECTLLELVDGKLIETDFEDYSQRVLGYEN
jgi:ATP-binding cassette subfamily F protein 1